MGVEEIIFEVSDALRVPVLALAVAAIALVIFELGSLTVELVRRRHRSLERLDWAVLGAREALRAGDEGMAKSALLTISSSTGMERVLLAIVDQRTKEGGADRIAKVLADFDYSSVRRLERTRILVRAGPALGLMGTLIPLSPALVGLADGDVQTLTENLRVAFSVTVAGLLVGGIAFAVSLTRDRLYGQDFSDLQYVASQIPAAGPAMPPIAVPVIAATAPVATATPSAPATP